MHMKKKMQMRFIVDARHMSTFTIDAPAKQQKTLVSLLHLDKKKEQQRQKKVKKKKKKICVEGDKWQNKPSESQCLLPND